MFKRAFAFAGSTSGFESVLAADGTYNLGQALVYNAGEAAVGDGTVRPLFLCQEGGINGVTVDGEKTTLVVERIPGDQLYETTFSGAATGVVPGAVFDLAANGMNLSPAAPSGAGVFRVEYSPAGAAVTINDPVIGMFV